MDIFDYVDSIGDYTFEEKKFNEVDNVVLSTLSYVDYSNIVSSSNNYKMTINEVSDLFFRNNKSSFFDIMAVKAGIKLLQKISNKIRYKDILMYNYEYVGNENCQFSAVTFEINKKLCYVAFEGTDELISGWKEDCMMSYIFPVAAQKYSIDYLNKHFTFNLKKLIVGGHSKGGNLALVSSMYCNFFVKSRILKIYSNDGPGLRDEELNSSKYNSIKDRYIHIIPHYSVVGLLLGHDSNYKVIKSTKKGLLAHNVPYWVIEGNRFKEENLSKFSNKLDYTFKTWLNKYDYAKRERFVKGIFLILEENNITSTIQVKKDIKYIFQIIKSSKKLDEESSEMLKELIDILKNANNEYNLDEMQIN